MKPLRIGVIFGGRSGEHEVSLRSAEHVLKELDPLKYEALQIGITKEGHWISHGKRTLQMLSTRQSVPSSAVLLPEPGSGGIVSLSARTRIGLLPVDVFFPVLHGSYGEDGTIQGLFELADIPYVGCGVLASAIGMDKVIQKQLFQYHRIPVAPYLFFYHETWKRAQPLTLERIENLLRYPLFVKPARLGSSVGVTKASNRRMLLRGISLALSYDDKVIVEEGIEEPREFECGVIGDTDPKVSPIGEVRFTRSFYDYRAKYIDRQTEIVIPAEIPKDLCEQIQNYTREVFHCIEGSGMSRVDFLYCKRNDSLYVNEVNTIPAFGSNASFPRLWQADNLPMRGFLDELIAIARQRHTRMRKIKRSFRGS